MIENYLYQEMYNDFFPQFRKLSLNEKYAITLGGSHGKGISDKNSDFDFRIFYEKGADEDTWSEVLNQINILVKKWKEKGVEVDGVWPRSIDEVDNEIEAWFSGKGVLVPYEWTIWGYNILTDIYNQKVLEDPFGIAEGWKMRLKNYDYKLQESIIKKYSSSLFYWRNDYHFKNKVNREDAVFLASITTRLINDIMQIIYALNKFYFPGDGMNLLYTQEFIYKPKNFEKRVKNALYPNKNGLFQNQYNELISLIDETLDLINEV